ncbi:MAG: LysR family transcriptional regulator [Spirochaetota bacterium]|nr:LysR family transcriptional regulator [Spirochaetota bacterium]
MRRKSEFDFNLKQLRSFLAIIDENSFTKASRRLKIGQGTISHHIQLLEDMLGIKLIHRTSKEFSITREGRVFKTFCENLFREIERLKVDFNKGIFGGIAKISSSTIPSTYILPNIIFKLNKEHHDFFYSIEIFDSREAVEMVKEGKADVGIVGKQLKHPSLTYKPVYSDEVVLIGLPKYPDFIMIDDIVNIPFISRKSGSGTRDTYETNLNQHGISPSDLRIIVECSTSESIKESVLSGIGVSFISRLAIQNELYLKTLKVIEIKGLRLIRDFFVVYQKNKHISIPVQLFIEALLSMNNIDQEA